MFRTVAACQRDNRASASFHLFDVVQVFRKNRIIRSDEDRGEITTDQRNDAVLELRARVAFGKKIRDLLHLQRTFESNREVELSAEEQKTVRIRISAGDFLDLII